MSINSIDSIADQTQQQLFAQYETLFSASSALAEQMQQRFKQWRTETKEVLARDFPLAAQQQELDDWQQQTSAQPSLLAGTVKKQPGSGCGQNNPRFAGFESTAGSTMATGAG